jgi:hypothetical protein
MNRTSSAIALGCLVVIALVAVTLAPKTYRHDAGAAAIPEQVDIDRVGALPFRLAQGRCFNGRCF